jgi:hypothetical protein
MEASGGGPMAVDTAGAPLLTLDEAAAMLLCPDTQGPAGRHRRWRCGRVSVTFWRMGNGVARVVRQFGFSTPFPGSRHLAGNKNWCPVGGCLGIVGFSTP